MASSCKTNHTPAVFFLKMLAALLFLLPVNSFCQTTASYVPADAPFVFSMHLGHLDKKVNLAQLQQYEFYSAFIKEYSKEGADEEEQAYLQAFMLSPSDVGYDMLEPFYFFVKEEGNNYFLTSVAKMGDLAKFEAGLQKLKTENYDNNLQQKEGYRLWHTEKEAFAWNDAISVNVWRISKPAPEPVWEEPSEDGWPEDTIGLDETIYDSIAIEDVTADEEENWLEIEGKAAVAAWVEKILRRQFLSLPSNEAFLKATAQSSDMHLWMDYSYFVESMNRQTASLGGMVNNAAQYMDFLKSFMEIFYADTYLSMGLNFENGKMAVRSDLFFNEEMEKLYKGMLDVKFNKKFLRYVKGGDQLFGYMYFNVNVKKTIEEGKELLFKLFDMTPGYGQMASDAAHILGIFIDEDAIGNLLKGDLMLAVSGLQTAEVTTTTYEFDEDFNMTPKDTTYLKTVPVFTAMLSYGNEKDIMKFVNLGLHSSALVQEGNYYKVAMPNETETLYLALNKGVILFTNDKDLVQNRLSKGFAGNRRLDKKHRKLLCENATVMYWDIPNTLKAATANQPGSDVGMSGYVNLLGKKFENLQITASKKVDHSIKSRFDFNFVNKNVNALEQFFRFVNDVYIEFIGGAKI